MNDNLHIHAGNDIQGHKDLMEGTKGGVKKCAPMTPENSGKNGGLLIWDICKKGAKCIIDIYVMNTDTHYYVPRYPQNIP